MEGDDGMTTGQEIEMEDIQPQDEPAYIRNARQFVAGATPVIFIAPYEAVTRFRRDVNAQGDFDITMWLTPDSQW